MQADVATTREAWVPALGTAVGEQRGGEELSQWRFGDAEHRGKGMRGWRAVRRAVWRCVRGFKRVLVRLRLKRLVNARMGVALLARGGGSTPRAVGLQGGLRLPGLRRGIEQWKNEAVGVGGGGGEAVKAGGEKGWRSWTRWWCNEEGREDCAFGGVMSVGSRSASVSVPVSRGALRSEGGRQEGRQEGRQGGRRCRHARALV